MYKLFKSAQFILSNARTVQYCDINVSNSCLKTSSLNNGPRRMISTESTPVTCDFSHDNKIALVAFNAPAKLNALTVEMGSAFMSIVQDLSTKVDLRAVILTGKGMYFNELYSRSIARYTRVGGGGSFNRKVA